MNIKQIKIITICLAVILLVSAGCTSPDTDNTNTQESAVQDPTTEPTAEPTAAPMKKSDAEEDIAAKYDGLTGAELYNAIMLERYDGMYMYEMEDTNNYNTTYMKVYYRNGSYKEEFTNEGKQQLSTIMKEEAYLHIQIV